MFPLLLPLLACTPPAADRPPPEPKNLGELGLLQGSGTLVWRGMQALAGATIRLPPPSAEPAASATFTLNQDWTPAEDNVGRLRSFTHPLPFHNEMPRPNYAPMGARMYRAGVEIPFTNDPSDLRGMGWFVEAGTVKVLTMESPQRWTSPPHLEIPELARALDRRTWRGDQPPAAFVAIEWTTAGVTRPAVQLPPGGEIAWSVDAPAGALLAFGVAAQEALLDGENGASGTVTWLVDGKALGSLRVEAGGVAVDRETALSVGRHEVAFRADGASTVNVVVTAPTVHAPTQRPPRRVVMVGIDTLRQDALGIYGRQRPTSPELDAWAGQSVVFTHAYAPAPRTRPSFRSALTGRYPLAAASAPTLAAALGNAGFRTAGFAANVHLVPRFGFNEGFEHWHYENGARARAELNRASKWLTAHADEDSFVFVHLMDPHTYYNAPEPYGSRFVEGKRPRGVPQEYDRWQVYGAMERPDFGDAQKAWIRADYDGEVAYLSRELAAFFSEVDALPGQTLTVVHSDHGEEFWDHGAFEHNHTLYEELVRAVLWIRPPGGVTGTTEDAPVGLIDIVPTVLDLVGATPIGSDGRSLAALLDPTRAQEREALRTALRDRPLALGHLMFGTERWGAIFNGWKYILHTGTGEEELYDLVNDRGEQTDRAATPGSPELEAGRAALATATGWAVRPGWRIKLDGPRAVVRLDFSSPVASASVIDPEAERVPRANLEWGERPLVTPEQVADVELSPDRTSVVIRPGPHIGGHRIQVGCEGECPAATVTVGARTTALQEGLLAIEDLIVSSERGTIIEVPAVEESYAAAHAGQLEALEQLGYLAPD